MGAAAAQVTIEQAPVLRAGVIPAWAGSAVPGLEGPGREGPGREGPGRGGPRREEPRRGGPRREGPRREGPGREGFAGLLAEGRVRSGGEVGPDNGTLPDVGLLPVLPALRDLLPHGALARGSVVSAGTWSLLCLALAAGPVAAGAWCAVAGIAELGVAAAADAGLDPARLLLVPDLGPNWPQVVISLLDGCDLVILRPPDRPPAQARRKLEAAVRRHAAVLLVAGDWDGAQVRLRVAAHEWTGIGQGHGRLLLRRAQVVADGRGGWSRSQARLLWLPGPDGAVAAVTGEPALAPAAEQASTG